MNYNKFISISIGDIDGIGIEIIIKLWKQKKIKNFILFTNLNFLKKYLIKNNINLNLNIINKNQLNSNKLLKNKFNVFVFNAKNKSQNTINSLKYSYELTKIYNLKGLLTLPINKEKIIKKNIKNFIGHTEFLEKLDNKKITNMIFIKNKIIFSTLTTHVKIQDIPKIITSKEYLLNKLLILNTSLRKDFNIKKPKILIAGLNPHAGENGLLGTEENKIIKPVINKLNKISKNFYGPISADSMVTYNNFKKYDCLFFMYHDQALIPFKFISKNSGTNFTSNLSVIRVSPDHGTAFDIVGKNVANAKAVLNSLKILNKISINRKKFV